MSQVTMETGEEGEGEMGEQDVVMHEKSRFAGLAAPKLLSDYLGNCEKKLIVLADSGSRAETAPNHCRCGGGGGVRDCRSRAAPHDRQQEDVWCLRRATPACA